MRSAQVQGWPELRRERRQCHRRREGRRAFCESVNVVQENEEEVEENEEGRGMKQTLLEGAMRRSHPDLENLGVLIASLVVLG